MLPPRFGRWSVEHPFTVDVLFAAVVGTFTVIGLVTAQPTGSERSADLWAGLLVLGQVAAFAFRRRTPIPSLLCVAAFTVVFWIADYSTDFEVMSLLAVYAATAHGGADRVKVWRVVGAVVAAMSFIAVVGVLSPSEDLPAAAVLGIAALHLTAAVMGEVVHDRRERLVELEQRAIRAETERGLLARHAVLDERARIARDLHDVVAHGMSVMIVQAGAAERVVRTDPDGAATALAHVQRAGREALSEMRRMLDVLREEEPGELALTPQPTLDDLHHIARRCTESGIPTQLLVEGELPAISVGQEMAAYRIVQEALTNVIKHAGRPARAVVRVQYRSDHISVEVTDDGAGATEAQVNTATGHGFVGMRERVDLYRGRLRYGPRPGGGFRVAATIPLDRVSTGSPR